MTMCVFLIMTVCIFHDYVCIFNHDCVFLIMTVCIFHDCVCILGMGFRRVPVMDGMYRVEGDPAC
jgi:hypothetical protein